MARFKNLTLHNRRGIGRGHKPSWLYSSKKIDNPQSLKDFGWGSDKEDIDDTFGIVFSDESDNKSKSSGSMFLDVDFSRRLTKEELNNLAGLYERSLTWAVVDSAIKKDCDHYATFVADAKENEIYLKKEGKDYLLDNMVGKPGLHEKHGELIAKELNEIIEFVDKTLKLDVKSRTSTATLKKTKAHLEKVKAYEVDVIDLYHRYTSASSHLLGSLKKALVYLSTPKEVFDDQEYEKSVYKEVGFPSEFRHHLDLQSILPSEEEITSTRKVIAKVRDHVFNINKVRDNVFRYIELVENILDNCTKFLNQECLLETLGRIEFAEGRNKKYHFYVQSFITDLENRIPRSDSEIKRNAEILEYLKSLLKK